MRGDGRQIKSIATSKTCGKVWDDFCGVCRSFLESLLVAFSNHIARLLEVTAPEQGNKYCRCWSAALSPLDEPG